MDEYIGTDDFYARDERAYVAAVAEWAGIPLPPPPPAGEADED